MTTQASPLVGDDGLGFRPSAKAAPKNAPDDGLGFTPSGTPAAGQDDGLGFKPQASPQKQPKQPAPVMHATQPDEVAIKQKYGLPATADLSKEFFNDANREVKDPIAFSQAYQEMHPPKPHASGFFSNIAQETKDIAKGMFSEPSEAVPSADVSGPLETAQSLRNAATSARQGKAGEAALHATEAVPMVGQPIAARIRQYQSGDKKGALGAALVDALMTALGVRGMLEGAPEEATATPETILPEERPGLPAGPAAARALPPAPQQRPAIQMPKQTPTVIPSSGETIAAPGQPQAALPAGKETPALPPGPKVPLGDQLQSFAGPGEKPILLPERTPTRIPPGKKPIAVGPVADDGLGFKPTAKPVVRPLSATKAPATAEVKTPTATDLKLQIKQLDNQYRTLNDRLTRTRKFEVSHQITAKQRVLAARIKELRGQLEQIEPRPMAKPFTYSENERIGPRIGGDKTFSQPPAPKESKTPTYDRLPTEMRQVVDALSAQHNHLPQSLREANEADMRKLAEPGTPRKEQYARYVAKDAGIEREPKKKGPSAVDFLNALGNREKPEARPITNKPEAGISPEA
ncbi:MAG: hypothetical protein ACRD3S_12610, partial [Terracidiphilus sp.]